MEEKRPATLLGRKEIADRLKQMAVSYWCHLRYGVFLEVGVLPWGRRRADMVGLKINGDVVICEIKSCRADLQTDQKLVEYMPHCNRMYLVMPELYANIEIPDNVGVMVPDARTGYLKVVRPAKRMPMKGRDKRNLVMRLAWRAATYSKRTRPRRTRIWLET